MRAGVLPVEPDLREEVDAAEAQAFGKATSRRYQTSFMKSTSPMPESFDSGQKGTTIFLSKSSFFSTMPRSRAEPVRSMRKSQAPLRFSHDDSRRNCMRGYSGRGMRVAFVFMGGS